MSDEHAHAQQKVTQNKIWIFSKYPNVCQMKGVSKTSHHEREMLALLPDASPANSIQVGSFKLCPTTWHDQMIREGHDGEEPD